MLWRKKWTALCTALLAGTMFVTGCGGDSAKSDSGKEENVLVFYNCNTDDWTAPLVKEFQEKTGIEVQLVAGGSGELFGRVKAEKDNPLGDVIWGGVRDSYVGLKPYLMPYASSLAFRISSSNRMICSTMTQLISMCLPTTQIS